MVRSSGNRNKGLQKNIKNKMKISKPVATVLIVFVSVVFIYVVRIFANNVNLGLVKKILRSRTIGDAKARVRIIEYIDFQCPACANGARLLKEYTKKYPSQIYLEVRYFPIIQIHPQALKSALYAECAARQNKFWSFENLLIERQSQWTKSADSDRMFNEIAHEVNLEPQKLKACVDDDDVKLSIFREKAEGKSLGVDSTPTYFVNGKMVVGPKSLVDELSAFFGEKKYQ